MKKIILELLKKYFDSILNDWTERIKTNLPGRFTDQQINTFVRSSLNTLMEVIETSEYSKADEYLLEIYNLFSRENLNLLEVSQLFSYGRHSIINHIEKDDNFELERVFVVGFIDEIVEQIYARYGMLHQNTKMKELENDRNRLASKLQTNQEYLRNILYTSDSAIMIVDKDEKFTEWNKGAEKIFGYTKDEILGKPSSYLLPSDGKYEEELQYIKNEVKNNDYAKLIDTERKTKDGRVISVQLNVTKLVDKDDQYAGRTVIIKDYTEVKRLQQQVDQSEKLAVVGQLAAGVAHEIGNPLTSISSLVQILQRRSDDEFVTEQLANIKENIERISKIVRELVDLSRPPGFTKERSQITDVIKTALGIVKYDKRVKKVNFKTDLDENLPVIEIIPDQLLQVFVNILLNALDAIEGNGTIDVKSYHDNDYIYIDITDDGTGIEERVVDKIFDPFFTTKEVGKGTGLGLSVSYGIIKKFNGDILIDSELNKGTTFTIKLPINKT
jgi:PAS domain S-box-containing protein